MFLINEVLVFSPGRRQEALGRLAWIHGLMAGHAGFNRAIVAKYLGAATSHTVLRLWQDEAAYRTFRETPDGNYGRGRPEGLYTNERVVPQWNSVIEGSGAAGGAFLVKVQWELAEDAWKPFLDYEKRTAETARGHGLVGADTFRAREGNQALTIARFASRDGFESLIDSPELSAARLALPDGAKHVLTQCYEVVSEVGPREERS